MGTTETVWVVSGSPDYDGYCDIHGVFANREAAVDTAEAIASGSDFAWERTERPDGGLDFRWHRYSLSVDPMPLLHAAHSTKG